MRWPSSYTTTEPAVTAPDIESRYRSHLPRTSRPCDSPYFIERTDNTDDLHVIFVQIRYHVHMEEQPLSTEDRAAALAQFKAEGKKPEWIAGWWRNQMRLTTRANPFTPLPDTDDDDPTMTEDERMLLVTGLDRDALGLPDPEPTP